MKLDKKPFFINKTEKLTECGMLRIRGRHTVKDDMLAFDWSGSGFAFNFSGTGFILSLGEYISDCPAYVRITVDGGLTQRFAVVNGSEKLIIEGLTDTRHRAEVIKVTEGQSFLKFDTITLLGQNACWQNPPFNSPRRIEFIGDSITCGYGVLANPDSPTYYTYQQDNTYSYAGLTAAKLGADARYIAISGKGIVCNCDGDRTDERGCDYYKYLTRTGKEDCNDGWIPEVVVINLGTNDCGGPAGDEEFKEAAKDLISKVRARYPDAHIIWMYGLMSNLYVDTLRTTIREVKKNDKKVYYIHVETMFGNESETGANGHPNVRASIRASALLVKKIRSITGWKHNVQPENA